VVVVVALLRFEAVEIVDLALEMGTSSASETTIEEGAEGVGVLWLGVSFESGRGLVV